MSTDSLITKQTIINNLTTPLDKQINGYIRKIESQEEHIQTLSNRFVDTDRKLMNVSEELDYAQTSCKFLIFTNLILILLLTYFYFHYSH